jgi:hypothetical protein
MTTKLASLPLFLFLTGCAAFFPRQNAAEARRGRAAPYAPYSPYAQVQQPAWANGLVSAIPGVAPAVGGGVDAVKSAAAQGQPQPQGQPAAPVAASTSTPTPAPAATAGCTKDTDCKGDRVCDRGTCTAPAKP